LLAHRQSAVFVAARGTPPALLANIGLREKNWSIGFLRDIMAYAVSEELESGDFQLEVTT